MHLLSVLKYIKPDNFKSRLTYLEWKRFISNTEYLSKEDISGLQWMKLKELLEHSYKHVPFYRNLFSKLKIYPSEIDSFDAFSKIPFLTKEMVRENPLAFVSEIQNAKKLSVSTTGGSTGKPLGFYRNPKMNTIEAAFMFHQWGRVGFKESSKRVILRGEPVKGDRLFSKHRFDRVWLMSSYHLSQEYIADYVEGLNRIKPEFFHVYPTSFFLFTKLFLQSGLKLNFQVKAILCGSEPVFDYQRKLFEETFSTRVYSWLGHAEGAVLAGECEHSSFYHVWPQHSYVELIDKDGKPVTEKGKSGEIVGTTINNLDAPFIRYKTGDIGIFEDDHCPHCGRNYMILSKIEGRAQDKIILDDGRQVPLTAITFGLHFDAYRKINKMQIVQKAPSHIEVLVDVLNSIVFDENDENEISTKMKNAVNGRLKIKFIYTANLRKTQGGKHIYFIQEIKTELL